MAKKETNEKKIADFIEQIQAWFSYFKVNNDEADRLKRFLFGEQWEDKAEEYYKTHNKVPMIVNKLYAIVMQLIGEVRQISPNLKITPVDYEDEKIEKVIEDAKFIEDIVKSIAYNSKSDIVYETAYKNQLEIGYGAIFVTVDYRNENSFDQEISLLPIEEPNCCYWDPSAKELDKSDGEYCGMITNMSLKEFKSKYPDVDIDQTNRISSFCDTDPRVEWISKDSVTIAEHYVREWKSKKISKLNDGTTVDTADLDSTLREKRKRLKALQSVELLAEINGKPMNLTNGLESIEVIDERETSYCKIRHYRMMRNEILEENEWASKFLPMVYVDGDSYYLSGVQVTRPFIKFAVDPQRFLNYCATETISYIRGGRKERFLATTANVEQHKKAWQGVDNDNMALLYDPDPKGGTVPVPITPLEVPASLLQQYQRAEHDIHTVLGRYEPTLGARSNEVSGVAINARIQQGNVTALVYPDNLLRAQTQVGKIILDLIPTVYDTYRSVLMDKEGVGKVPVKVNKLVGKDKYENKIEKKDYDVEVSAGPSFSMQKAESYAQLMDLIAKIPAFGQIIPDLAAENLELSNTPKIVERAKKYLIPSISMEEKGEKPPPPKPKPEEVMMTSVAESEKKKGDASMLTAQSKMITAQTNMRKDFDKKDVAKIQSAAEIGKAQLQYQQEVLKTHSLKLQRENDILKDALNLVK